MARGHHAPVHPLQPADLGTVPAARPGAVPGLPGGAGAWGAVMACYGAGSVLGALLALGHRPRRPIVAATLATFGYGVPCALLALRGPLAAVAAGALVAGVGSALGGTFAAAANSSSYPQARWRGSARSRRSTAVAFGPLAFAAAGPVAAVLGAPAVLGLGAAWSAVTQCGRPRRPRRAGCLGAVSPDGRRQRAAAAPPGQRGGPGLAEAPGPPAWPGRPGPPPPPSWPLALQPPALPDLPAPAPRGPPGPRPRGPPGPRPRGPRPRLARRLRDLTIGDVLAAPICDRVPVSWPVARR